MTTDALRNVDYPMGRTSRIYGRSESKTLSSVVAERTRSDQFNSSSPVALAMRAVTPAGSGPNLIVVTSRAFRLGVDCGPSRRAADSPSSQEQARGKKHSLAGLHDEEQAAVLRDRMMLHLFGKAAVLNFPTRKLKPASSDQLQRELREQRSASRYRGVSQQVVAQRQTWSVQIVVRQKMHFLGRYGTERQTAIAYDRAASYYLGDKAKLNLPAASRRLPPR